MFFTDFSLHLNELNVKLQGFGKSIDVMFGMIRCFERFRKWSFQILPESEIII